MEPLLIQQRMALERIRLRALWAMWAGGLLVVAGVTGLILGDSRRPTEWMSIMIWAVIVIYGIVEMRNYRRRVRAFDAEHGAEAGRQRSR